MKHMQSCHVFDLIKFDFTKYRGNIMLGANGVNIKHTSYLLDNNDISKQCPHKAIKDDTLELSLYGDVP